MPDPVFLSGSEVPDYLRGVELMTAGMEWPAMNGPCTVTMEHLADAVRAYSDPHIQAPRIKLGHTSAVNGDHPDFDPFAAIGDAEPAFGQFTNLRLTNDGAVLVGDADNVPAWLAEMAPSAYPSRSAEGDWRVSEGGFDVQTNGGRRYSFVCTAVSLLGVYIPAIGDLEDLQALIMSGPAALTAKADPVAAMEHLLAGLKAGSDDRAAIAAARGLDTDVARTALSVSHGTIRDRFNWDWACERVGNDFDGDTTWWWARDIRFDPDEIIADDDEGHLWSVPFSTDGEDAVTFGEPSQVRQTFVPVAASGASFSRPDKRTERPAAVAAATNAATVRPNTEGGEPMDPSVREFLVGQGHDPETATTEQVSAAEAYCAAFPATPATADEPDDKVKVPEAAVDTPEAEAETPSPETERVPVAAARQIPDGMSLIDSETLAALKAGAAAGSQLAAEKATERRDRVLMAARDEGRIPPSRLEHYTRLYDADPEGTTVLLTAAEDKGGLAKGTVPLAARAEAPDPLAAGADGLTAADRSLLATSRSRMGFKAGQEA